MLRAFVLQLLPPEGGEAGRRAGEPGVGEPGVGSAGEAFAGGELGRANYAQTLARIAAEDPALAKALHDQDGVKPLACSGALSGSRGQMVRVGISATAPAVSACLKACLLERPPAVWELDRRQYTVAKVVCDAAEEPWSGEAACEEIVRRHLSDSSACDTYATLALAAPLCFRTKGMTMALPLPSLVFGSLLDRWNQVAALVFDEGMRAFADQHISVSRFNLRSEAVRQKREGLRIGSVGSVSYRALLPDRYWVGVMQALVDFAFFSGVGANTTTGMGLVRRQGHG